jgi:hypothetical protein
VTLTEDAVTVVDEEEGVEMRLAIDRVLLLPVELDKLALLIELSALKLSPLKLDSSVCSIGATSAMSPADASRTPANALRAATM